MREAPIDPDLLERLGAQIMDTFGDETVMVRFRSSSNAEDALAFSGAGLYDSTSACLADELDADSEGPSHCDPEKSEERTLGRALGKIWASMWKMEAFEERAWYGIDHSQAVMGLLINTRSVNEQANIVAFTGSPTTQDDRILVNAQQGELDVVSSEPGVFPEKALLDMEETTVKEIIRVNRSSEQPDSWILSDLELTELGELFAEIELSYPRDEEPPAQQTLLLDTEWKVLSSGQLIIKQIRPFLRDDTP
jgi:phosphoenolpyruvate synthase/pyruvate phosphate dikinase